MDIELEQNYAALRLQRGWSWSEMADHLEAARDKAGAGAELAAWARRQAAVDDKSARANPKGTERAVSGPRERR